MTLLLLPFFYKPTVAYINDKPTVAYINEIKPQLNTPKKITTAHPKCALLRSRKRFILNIDIFLNPFILI